MIVEDGTAKNNANSYVDFDFADLYWEAEINNTWAVQSDDAKEVALIQATKELDKKFNRKWIGTKSTRDQALCWPRINAIDTDGYTWDAIVPIAVKYAVCELALQVINGTDLRNKAVPSSTIKSKSTKVGEITVSTTYDNPSATDTPLNAIDNIIASLIIFGGGLTVKAYRV